MSESKTGLQSPTRAFISYSWSSPTHETRVMSLAERLLQDGIDIILDKWDLKAGHDSNVFMEQMVSDPAVTKVVMICDRMYVEKANARSGGVGTESQIISPQLYESHSAEQTKFAAVCMELDNEGKPYVPVFYKGRIYFDFTAQEREETAYEELLRWLADKPRYLKPKLGSLPAFISNPELAITSTASRARRAEEALRNGTPNARGALVDYFDGLVTELPSFRIQRKDDPPHDESVMAAIDAMRPYASEFQAVAGSLLRYKPEPEVFDDLLDALERIATFMFRPEDVRSWNDDDFDAYIVFAHDLFLSTFGRALKSQHFGLAQRQIERRYVVHNADQSGQRISHSFEIFCGYPRSLDRRNARLKLNRSSLHADLIDGWYKGHELGMPAILQADFVLWLASEIRHDPASYERWYPYTTVYTGWGRVHEIFARAESRQYFSRIAPLFNGLSVGDFQKAVAALDQSDSRLRAGHRPLSITALTNANNLGALP